jgi:hypothetical protein
VRLPCHRVEVLAREGDWILILAKKGEIVVGCAQMRERGLGSWGAADVRTKESEWIQFLGPAGAANFPVYTKLGCKRM